jgi:sugar phosphate isomerase/epimerase
MLKAALIGFYGMRKENDPWETIKKLSGWGYKALESGYFLLHGDVGENLKKLAEYDFSVLSVSTDIGGLKDNLGDIAAKAEAVRVKNVVCYWSDAQNYGEALENAKIFDKAGEKLRGEGLSLCYHNHDHEFKKSFGGAKYFDILMAHTSPENFYLDLDAGWASVGGENAVELVKRTRDRIKLMHFKDFYDLGDRNSFTALGTGKVKIQEILAEAAKTGIEYVTVEQDIVRNLNVDDTVLLSYLTLKESGLVE